MKAGNELDYAKVWSEVSSKYEAGIAELIADSLILLLKVSGFGDQTIADHLELSPGYVRFICQRRLLDEGVKDFVWSEDLGFSPWWLYKKTGDHHQAFVDQMAAGFGARLAEVNGYFHMCRKYAQIKKEIDNYYGNGK